MKVRTQKAGAFWRRFPRCFFGKWTLFTIDDQDKLEAEARRNHKKGKSRSVAESLGVRIVRVVDLAKGDGVRLLRESNDVVRDGWC